MAATRRRGSWISRTCAARRAGILLLLFLLGSAASSLHSALVPHQVCVHGELVHGDAATHRTTGGGDHLAPDDGSAASTPDAEEREHEHCGLATPVRFGPAPVRPALRITLAPATTPGPIRESVARPETFPRYLLAPHHSPPAS